MPDPDTPRFTTALPIWPAGLEREMNRFIGFRAIFPRAGSAMFRITASSLYRAFLNGDFIGCGPARAAHGYFRVDEWPLDARRVIDGDNLLAIEVAGYNVNSYYVLDQPAFLQAEVIAHDGRVLAATMRSPGAFAAFLLDDHVQRVERYSVARTFCEAFRLHDDSDHWRTKVDFTGSPVVCAEFPPVKLLPRRVSYSNDTIARVEQCIAAGTLAPVETPAELRRESTITGIGPHFKGFPQDQLEVIPSLELQRIKSVPGALDKSVDLSADKYQIFDFGRNLTGFVILHFTCATSARVAVVFDEMLMPDGDVIPNRMRCNNVIWIDAQPGAHRLESFEPYTMRYVKLMCLASAIRLDRIALRLYEHPPLQDIALGSDDGRLNRIFDAAVATFRQNALDLFMDCPSRERAGWLCDSFYTARVAHELTGSTVIEKNFLENYLLPERFEHLPEGMIAMNYPADHPNGMFIPNWAMWLVLQLEEYLARSGDRAMIDAFRPRVEALLRYFDQFRNSEGLLERLDGWIFVEWSAANEFVQDVNFPTNMLYAAALDAAARMYERHDWASMAKRMRETVLQQSFDGEFFVDNAQRRDRQLARTRNRTEVCQYYAFYFGVATPMTHPNLWRTLLTEFGPRRRTNEKFADIPAANMLMGCMMRLELLARYRLLSQLHDEVIEYCLPMADLTGTLWEHTRPTESCNHGFASHVAHILLQARENR